jgi:AmpD protein
MQKWSAKGKWITIFILGGFISLGFFYGLFFKESRVVIENKPVAEDIVEQSAVQEKGVGNEQSVPAENNNKEIGLKAQEESGIVEKDKGGAASKNEEQGELIIVNRSVSFGQEKRSSRSIDTIVIHSSYDALGGDPFSVSGIVKEYQEYGVAAHYLIDRVGTVYQLVADKDVAYHAGLSSVPDGRKGVNEFSLGIELINTKTSQYTNKQYEALNSLLRLLKNKYSIRYVLGHNQIAPERKDDPWNFQWNRIK